MLSGREKAILLPTETDLTARLRCFTKSIFKSSHLSPKKKKKASSWQLAQLVTGFRVSQRRRPPAFARKSKDNEREPRDTAKGWGGHKLLLLQALHTGNLQALVSTQVSAACPQSSGCGIGTVCPQPRHTSTHGSPRNGSARSARFKPAALACGRGRAHGPCNASRGVSG